MRFLMLNWRDPENPLAGGAERVSLGYLAALARRGHQVSWFANAFNGCSPRSEIEGIEIVRGGGMGTSILKARAWHKRQPKFDLVIDQHHGIPWFAPWWCGTHCVAYIHEVLGPIWKSFYPWPLSWIGRAQERWTHWLYRNIPFWTACESTRDDLLAHGVKQIKIIRYGVHTQALPELPPKPLAQPLRLIVVSRLAPNKRIDHAVRALAELRNMGLPAELTIIGSGQEEPKLRSLVGGLGLESIATFTGPLNESEKDVRLRESHWLLHTSQREGWGLNVIEANAMGTPAVVYPVEGLIESTLDGETGLVSSSETPLALAERIRNLQEDAAYQTLRRQAWERAKLFHWSRILPPACDWLESMARGERAGAG
jgi:glycosyltransferase involved in cell wall biosynthesis